MLLRCHTSDVSFNGGCASSQLVSLRIRGQGEGTPSAAVGRGHLMVVDHQSGVAEMSTRTVQSDPRSRTERARADRIKAGGVHYTPPELAAFMAAEALEVLGDREAVRILDPACGNAELLAAIVDSAPGSWSLEVVGCDLDEEALAAADTRFTEMSRPRMTWTFEKCDFLAEAARVRQSKEVLFAEPAPPALQAPFDLVIANPPYVRTQVLGADEARRLGDSFGLSGRVDLYHAFAVAMTEALGDSGCLVLLCSNRFMTTRTGSSLRAYFESELDLHAVYDLGDTKLFGAAVLPAVIAARRQSSGGAQQSTGSAQVARMTSVYESDSHSDGSEVMSVLAALRDGHVGGVVAGAKAYEVRRGELRLDQRGRRPWVLASGEDGWIARVDQATAMRFGEVGKIRVGIKTTADPVFISSAWDQLAEDAPEEELLLPLLTHHVAEKWRTGEPAHRVLYPYDLTKEKRTPLDLAEFPRATQYLNEHRERLEGRRYVVEGGRRWWEIWVPQRPSHWAAPKIVFPDISDKPRFFLDRTGAVVNGDCYWVALTSESSVRLGHLMMAVANSSLGTRYYDRVCGNKLYSGRRRYITQYVERFPIPDPETPEAAKIVDLVSSLVSGDCDDVAGVEGEIDALVWRSFGFEEVPR